jgi:hypothetical protein
MSFRVEVNNTGWSYSPGQLDSRDNRRIPTGNDDHYTSIANNVVDVRLPDFPIKAGGKLKMRVLDRGYSFLTLEAYHEHPWNIKIFKTVGDLDVREHTFIVNIDGWKLTMMTDENAFGDDLIDVEMTIVDHSVDYCFRPIPVEGMDGEDEDLELKEYQEEDFGEDDQ